MVVEVLSPEQLVAKSIAPVKREFWRADQEGSAGVASEPQAPAKSKRKQRQVATSHAVPLQQDRFSSRPRVAQLHRCTETAAPQ